MFTFSGILFFCAVFLRLLSFCSLTKEIKTPPLHFYCIRLRYSPKAVSKSDSSFLSILVPPSCSDFPCYDWISRCVWLPVPMESYCLWPCPWSGYKVGVCLWPSHCSEARGAAFLHCQASPVRTKTPGLDRTLVRLQSSRDSLWPGETWPAIPGSLSASSLDQ